MTIIEVLNFIDKGVCLTVTEKQSKNVIRLNAANIEYARDTILRHQEQGKTISEIFCVIVGMTSGKEFHFTFTHLSDMQSFNSAVLYVINGAL